MGKFFAPLTILVLLSQSCSTVQYWYVNANYQGTSSGKKSQPFTKITDAIDVANQGDTILVAPGLYQENVVLKNGVSLISELLGRAIIDGQADMGGGHPSLTGADSAVVDGFTITGGYNGVHCDGTSPTIRHCIIRSNYGDAGIVSLNGSLALIENNSILGNLGSSYNRRPVGIYIEQSNPTIRNNIVTGNYFGMSPYQSSPNTSYNNVWGNRSNYGYNATPGVGSMSNDPKFIDEASNDYRLATTSSCIDNGAPGASFNDNDGSRNDIGAFRNGNQRPVPPPFKIQEYFMEAVLGCVETTNGIRCDGLSRITQDPVFYFKNGAGTVGGQQVRAAIEQNIPLISGGRLNAQFISSIGANTNTCQIVTLSFVPTGGRGLPYFSGADCKDITAQQQQKRNGAPIIGGELDLPNSFMNGIEGANVSDKGTVIHELGHVLGLDHSYRGTQHVMTQLSGPPKAFSDVEVEVMRATFNYAPGHSLAQFKSSNFITEDVEHPFPHIDKLWRLNSNGLLRSFDTIAVGDFLVLEGSRFTLKYSCDDRIVFRPSDYEVPTVNFNGVEVTADLTNQTTYVGTPCAMLKIQVPPGAKSGYIFLKRRDRESNPVYLEIK